MLDAAKDRMIGIRNSRSFKTKYARIAPKIIEQPVIMFISKALDRLYPELISIEKLLIS